MPIPETKLWLKETDLGFGKIRSLKLVELDREIAAFNDNKSWTNAHRVSNALHAWRSYDQDTARNKKGAVDRLRDTFDFIYDIDEKMPDFAWERSPLGSILEMLELDGKVKAERKVDLQKRLDKISVTVADQFTEILQIIVEYNPDYAYVGMTTGGAMMQHPSAAAPTMHITDAIPGNRDVRYTSAKYSIELPVLHISAENAKHRIGFIQHCIAKSDVSTFTDGSKLQETVTGAFPIGDGFPGHGPWYFRGHSTGRPYPSYRQLDTTDDGVHRYYMEDGFANNFHPYHPHKPVTGVNVDATLTSILRKQSFVCWLVHKTPAGEYRLRHRFEYTINVSVTVSKGVVTAHSSSIDGLKNQPLTPYGTLPRVSAVSMNDKSQWKYQAPGTAGWVDTTL